MSESTTLKTPLPSGLGVMFYRLNRGGDMTPVARIERRADGPWEMFSGVANARACLEPLEEAHGCCLKVSMLQVAEETVLALAAKGLKPEGDDQKGAQNLAKE